ncbi:hypothetical protein [Streptomyces sp. NPDC001100]
MVVEHQREVAAVTKSLQDKGFSSAAVSDRVRDLPGLFGAADLAMRVGVLLLPVAGFAVGTLFGGREVLRRDPCLTARAHS